MPSSRLFIALSLTLSACLPVLEDSAAPADTGSEPSRLHDPTPDFVDVFEITNRDCAPSSLGSSEYFFCTNTLDWFAASADCAAAGFHLVTIDTAAENAFLFTESARITGSSVTTWWMGANDNACEGTWVWEDGTPFSYSAWHYDTREPNGGTSENCGQLNSHSGSGQWNDYGCSTFSLGYICER